MSPEPGLRVTVIGVPPEALAPAARRLLRSIRAPEGFLYVLETAQAAELLLDAIASSSFRAHACHVSRKAA